MKRNWILILLLLSFSIQAHESFFKQGFSVLGFGGIFVNSDLAPISYNLDFKYKPSYIWGAGINKKIRPKFSIFEFEVEGILAKHTGAMSHGEAVLVGVARIPNLWGSPFSFAFGEGQSYATENPKLENLRKGYDNGRFALDDIQSRPLLNYLVFELDYTLPWLESSKIFARIHHRSGIYGVYCPPTPPCGSNFIVYGFKTDL